MLGRASPSQSSIKLFNDLLIPIMRVKWAERLWLSNISFCFLTDVRISLNSPLRDATIASVLRALADSLFQKVRFLYGLPAYKACILVPGWTVLPCIQNSVLYIRIGCFFFQIERDFIYLTMSESCLVISWDFKGVCVCVCPFRSSETINLLATYFFSNFSTLCI